MSKQTKKITNNKNTNDMQELVQQYDILDLHLD